MATARAWLMVALVAVAAWGCSAVDGDPRRAAATWRFDGSGADGIPNDFVARLEDLPQYEGRAATGLRGGQGSYTMTFETEDGEHKLSFQVGVLAATTYDLGGIDGRMRHNDEYSSTAEGRGTLELRPGDADDRLEGTFSGRTCLTSTPGSNCWSFYAGEFKVFNETGERLMAIERFDVPTDFPSLSSQTRTRVAWGATDSPIEARGSSGVMSFQGRHTVSFERPSEQGGASYSLQLRTLEPGSYRFEEFGAKFTYRRPGQPTSYITDIDGGGGALEIVGNNGTAIWGTFSAKTCFARTPRANCFEFDDVRFAAALR